MEGQTTEVKPEAKGKKIKIKLLRDCLIGTEIMRAGTVQMVDEATAAEFCDRKFKGYDPYYGYKPEIGPLMGVDEHGHPLPDPLLAKTIVRAVRV